MCLFLFILILILKLLSLGLSEASHLSREELSSYECGFEPNNLSRVPFSLRYFFLTLVFLLFDLEVVLILFISYFIFSSFIFFNSIVLILFLFVLLAGLFYEWQDGTLDWLN